LEVNIRFSPSGRSVRVPPGTSVLEAIRRAGLPIASACGAATLCARCGVRVRSNEPLPGETRDETEAKRRNRVDPDLRLACRLAATGDLEVTATYW
jgi:ferredoxin